MNEWGIQEWSLVCQAAAGIGALATAIVAACSAHQSRHAARDSSDAAKAAARALAFHDRPRGVALLSLTEDGLSAWIGIEIDEPRAGVLSPGTLSIIRKRGTGGPVRRPLPELHARRLVQLPVDTPPSASERHAGLEIAQLRVTVVHIPTGLCWVGTLGEGNYSPEAQEQRTADLEWSIQAD